ncbi:hypothetical protein D3C71_1744720 [compost metagenome]
MRGAPVAHRAVVRIGGGAVRYALCGQRRHHLPHKKAAVLARLHQALGEQLVVRCYHRGWTHAMLLRALPYRGQAGSGREQAIANALPKAG